MQEGMTSGVAGWGSPLENKPKVGERERRAEECVRQGPSITQMGWLGFSAALRWHGTGMEGLGQVCV